MKILVTGGGGYIGTVLVPHLLAAGHEVRILDRLYWGDEPLAKFGGRVSVVVADARSIPDRALDNTEAVIHLAGLSNDPTANFWPEANYELNVTATERLVQQCVEKGVPRLLLGSSCSVYDGLDPMVIHDEEAQVAPRGPYAETKFQSEVVVLSAANERFHPTVFRQGTVFGWSPRMRFDLVVNTMARAAVLEGRLVVHGDGQNFRPLVEVNDLARAYVQALGAPIESISGRRFNVLSGNWTISEVADMVALCARAEGMAVRIDRENPPALMRDYRVSGERFIETTGWRPTSTIASAASEIVHGVRALGLSALHPRYSNIDWMLLHERIWKANAAFGSVV